MSEIVVKETSFKGNKTILMEIAVIKLIVLPQAGASIVSLQYKDTGKEWLVSSIGDGVRLAGYGDTFSEAMMHR